MSKERKPGADADASSGELTHEELDLATGAATNSDYTNMMQMMSQILQMLESTSKSIIGNMR